ncbi:MAG: alpha/beta fold hydrolase [Pilosibacter sp.]
MEKMTCRQGMADTPQVWIYYKESGRGTPILMLHGNAETHLIFDYYEKKLSMKYRVILMDSRAHGRSRIKPEYAESEFTTTDMARDAAALLDILHIPSCILFGFSDGANIALEFASLFPDRTRAVIAISGNVSPDGLILPVRAFVREILLSESGDKSVPGNLQKKSCRFLHPFMSFPSSTARFPALQFSHDVLEQLENVQAPVLLIAGTRDLVNVSHSRLMARLIPRAQLVLIKGATHTSMFGRKAFYLKIIHDFLDKSQA